MAIIIPTPQQRRQIAVREFLQEKQVLKTYKRPERVRSATLERVSRAARELGLPVPVVQLSA